jgi:hypothetical protein
MSFDNTPQDKKEMVEQTRECLTIARTFFVSNTYEKKKKKKKKKKMNTPNLRSAYYKLEMKTLKYSTRLRQHPWAKPSKVTVKRSGEGVGAKVMNYKLGHPGIKKNNV